MNAPPVEHDAQGLLAIIDLAIKNLGAAILVTDAGKATGRPRIVLCNQAVVDLTGYSRKEMLGESPIMLEGPGTDPALIPVVRRHISEGTSFSTSTDHQRKDGTLYHVDWQLAPIFDQEGALKYFIWMQQDVSARVEAERMRDTLVEALHLTGDPIIITDENDNIVFVNRGFEALGGYRASEIRGKPLSVLDVSVVDPVTLEVIDHVESSGERRHRFLLEIHRKNAASRYLDMTATRILEPGTRAIRTVHVSKDVTDMVLHNKEVAQNASHDALTGLLNRRSGEVRFEAAFEAALSNSQPFCAIMGDLDHFKLVNDSWGHPVGDRILVQAAHILTATVRPVDAVIRWGGEEFLILLEATDLKDAARTAERIRHEFEVTRDEKVGAVTISLGAAEWSPGESLVSLISRVDQTLYAAKSGGRNQVSLSTE